MGKTRKQLKKLKAKVQRMHEEAAASEDRIDSLQMRVEKLEASGDPEFQKLLEEEAKIQADLPAKGDEILGGQVPSDAKGLRKSKAN